ncbi:MAG: hemolysin family protein, partial [Candidatus Wallbacteria bacterium]|nr:hemolysin family protein [Candidatus Wallbacteria bacterium]
GALDRIEHRILYGIMEFSKKEASEIMTPRVDVKAIEIGTPITRVVKLALDTGLTRFPVCEKEIENIKGVLYAMDLIRGYSGSELKLSDFLRQSYYVPENKLITEILAEMKKKKLHMAIVIDEYGGMAGILTMDDILSEIFGELMDEFDRGEPDFLQLDKKRILVNARVSIDELNNHFQLSVPGSDEYETLGGMVFSSFGYMPRKGESLALDGVGKLEVFEADFNRIKKIIIELSSEEGQP